jgi:UDP-glucose:(heptosyl)LPS alpha-1,3-glucosyltransferase
MKIALVRQKYTDFGGAERYTAALAEHLLDAGHEVHAFANEWKGRKERTGNGRIAFHRVPMIKGLSVLEALSFAIKSRSMLKKERFDIIHSFERTIYQDVYRAGDGCHREWLQQRIKIDPPYKYFVNKINPLHLLLLWIEGHIFKEGNYRMIVANSVRGKDEIIKHYGVPPEKIQVVYNAVDTDRFNRPDANEIRRQVRKSLGTSLDDRVLIYVGSGFKRKGVAAAIASLAKLHSDTHLVVIGKDRIPPYQTIAKKNAVESRVHFVGPIVDVERYYWAGDLFLFPTVYEPFSNVCLEAMASGLPVVTSRMNGASEVIQEGKNGYVVENPTDPSEIAEKVGLGLALDSLSVEARNRELLNNFTWEEQLRKITDIYAAVAGGDTYYE